MTSGLEVAGDVATGALLARAVEPGHGGSHDEEHGACLNCGAARVGPYCHECGQSGHVHRTLTGFGHDLLHGVFHFEGKFWATLPMLFFRPGELTRRYVAGERAKFVSPVAMFLFCMFLMFAVVGGLAGEVNVPDIQPVAAEESAKELAATKQRNAERIDVIERQLAEAEKSGADTSELEAQQAALKQTNSQLDVAGDFVQGVRDGAGLKKFNLHTGWAPLDHGLQTARDNPDLFLYRLQTSAYKYSWLLIPISTPLVWLLFFWKRQYKVYDHLIFVTFSLIFMSLLITAGSLIGAAGVATGWVVTAIATIVPFHLYRQLRGAYPGSRTGAVVRTVLLLWFGLWALIIYTAILLTMGIMH